MISGDLLNQIISASFAARDFDFPFLGVYGACSTMAESFALAAALINAGYMVLEPQIFDYLDGDACVFEQKPLQKLAEEGQLMSYIHKGFWQCMDTAREKQVLEKMLATGNAPWKKWED